MFVVIDVLISQSATQQMLTAAHVNDNGGADKPL